MTNIKNNSLPEADGGPDSGQLTANSQRGLPGSTIDAPADMIQVFEAVRDKHGEIIDFRYLFVNDAAERWMPGASGKSLLELQPGVVAQGIFDIFKEVVGRGVAHQSERHYAHGQFSGGVYLSAVKLGDGVAMTITGTSARKMAEEEACKSRLSASDISSRRRAEAALRESELQYRAKLEAEVRERTLEITALNRVLVSNNRELESLHSELTTFNHVVSNDYKATIQALYLYMENIMKYEAGKLSDTGKSNVRKAQAAIQKLNLLTDDIIAFWKVRDLDPDFSRVNLQTILERTLCDMSARIAQFGAHVSVNERLPEISGYSLLLSLLFHHLLDNALKFMPPGRTPEITIGCRKMKAENISETFPGREYYELSFTDNGIGFPQKEARNLFRIFYRLHEKREYRGSGVGLAVCKKIMDIHQGSVKAKGNPGSGSTFYCCFPLTL